jgi:hypothetical protein
MADEESEVRTITIAGVTVEVLPQPLMYLTRRLKKLQGSISDDELDLEMTDLLFGRIGHQALSALIPDIGPLRMPDGTLRPAKIPLHAWMGFASEEAMQADELDESKPPHPPTFPEIRAAFDAAKEVNDFDLFERLFGMMDPQDRQELMGMAMSGLLTAGISSLTPSSLSLEDGSEASTSSTETSPTGTPNGSGSLSPASTG